MSHTVRRNCMLVATIALTAMALATLNLGRVRTSRVQFGHLEWTNGWPCAFLSRQVIRAIPGGDPEVLAPGSTVLWFSLAAAAADAYVGLGLLAAVSWAAWRRIRSGRLLQFGLRGLLLVVAAVAVMLGWELNHHRRQRRVIDDSADLFFGFYADQGLPHVIRSIVPGDRFRLFDRLTTVEIMGPNCVGDRLKQLSDLHELTMLDIGSNQVDDDAIKHLAGLKRLVSLRISASPNRLTDAGLLDLSRLPALRELDIGASQVTDAGLAYLRRSEHLEHLGLNHIEHISDAGLIQVSGLRSLKSLSLIGTHVGDAGVSELADLPNLTILLLGQTEITDTALMRLGEMEHLTLLDLRYTQVTDAGVARLKTALPGCRVIR